MSATLWDLGLVVLSLLSVGSLVALTRWIARRWSVPSATLRKALHAATGAWALLATPYFKSLGWALVPPVVFGIVNASGKVRELMPGMAESAREARGLWAFPLGVVLTYLLFWEEEGRRSILAGLTVLAFADPVAAIVGTRFGQRRWGLGHGRTLEGSAAFFLVAALGVGIVASGGGGAFSWRMGVGCGAAGAAAEALTPSGWDNVAIPLAVAAAYQVLA